MTEVKFIHAPNVRNLTESLKVIREDFSYYRQRLQIHSFLKAILLICFFHPGWQLIFSIRIQEQLGRLPFLGSILRRILWYITSILTGSEVSFFAQFGSATYFPHPTGVVIGDTWDIGDHVTIMQGVTLGRKDSTTPPKTRSKIDSQVMVCAGAVVVGEILIGENAVIGANAVVLCTVPPAALAVGVPAKIIERN